MPPHAQGHPKQMPHDTRLHLLSWPLFQTHKPSFSRRHRCHAFFYRQREEQKGEREGGREAKTETWPETEAKRAFPDAT